MNHFLRAAGEHLRRAAERSPFSRRYHTIEAVRREVTGQKFPAQERARGRIPAVVIGQRNFDGVASKKIFLTAEKSQIQSILDSVHPDLIYSTAFKLQVRAAADSFETIYSGTVLPHKVHRDEKTGDLVNLVLVCAEEGSDLTANVPVVNKGEEDCSG